LVGARGRRIAAGVASWFLVLFFLRGRKSAIRIGGKISERWYDGSRRLAPRWNLGLG
jgi:hypothetical protein